MSDMCTDNRFELIEKYKKKLVEVTNIETSLDEMQVLDDILFRFWQMGWLDSIDRMPLVKESARTLMHSGGDSIYAKALRNAGRFIQNAIDGEAPEFENIPSVEPELSSSEFPNNWIPNTKETVPKDPRRKQIQLKNGWIITGWFDEEDWNWYSVPGFDEPFKFEDVEAWRELPSPYKPKEDD